MQETISAILAKAQPELAALKTRAEFEAAKARYVGPNGEFTVLMKQMGTVPKEQKPAMGKLINEAKGKLIRRTPGFRHLLAAKSTKSKRRASRDKLVAEGHAKPLKRCLPFGL